MQLPTRDIFGAKNSQKAFLKTALRQAAKKTGVKSGQNCQILLFPCGNIAIIHTP